MAVDYHSKRLMEIHFTNGAKMTVEFTHQETRDGELHTWVEGGSRGAGTDWKANEHWFPLANITARSVHD